MEILFHTIAVEPERWTTKRVSRPLTELLGPLATAGFRELEIYEPHLGANPTSDEIRQALRTHDESPVILSSYLNLNPEATTDKEMEEGVRMMAERVKFYGFRKVRLFAGSKLHTDDRVGVAAFTHRVSRLADRLTETEILLETHDGSLADNPQALVAVVEEVARPNVGLLFQPTFLADRDATLAQFRLQQPFIRHLHLQNRNPDLTFAPMAEGVVPWRELFALGAANVGATLEFVPVGIGAPSDFDLHATLHQAKLEINAIGRMLG
jgi:sugar phosphate isomerase/epimerase